MGFSAGNYAKIKEVVDKQEKYTVCKLTISRKNKEANRYELTFASNFVKFVGNAHKSMPMAEQRIKLTACDVTTCYTKQDGSIGYFKNPQYVVYEYELQEGTNATSSTAPQFGFVNPISLEELSADSDLPF